MATQRPNMTPGAIRNVALPRSFRGFDEPATRSFLNDLASAVEALVAERDKLRVDLKAALEKHAPDAENGTAIGNALLAAQRAGEELVADAKENAARIAEEARAESERILERARLTAEGLKAEREGLRREMDEWQARLEGERSAALAQVRVDAEQLTSQSAQRVEALRQEEAALRVLITERHNQFVDLLQSTLGQLEHLDELASDLRHGPPDLPDLLKSRVAGEPHQVEAGLTYSDLDEAPPLPESHGLRLAGQDDIAEPPAASETEEPEPAG
jgi:cell division septum initiation protein DivIVA